MKETDDRFAAIADSVVPPGIPFVARLDGRGFSRLTNEKLELEKPFDLRFHDWMCDAGIHLMTEAGFTVDFGYVQSDEISLLFGAAEVPFNRSLRKLGSILAAEASAAFSQKCGVLAAFDCRLIPLAESGSVPEYFRSRRMYSYRNCLNAWCYWTLRKAGHSGTEATRTLARFTSKDMKALLDTHEIEFEAIPSWQKYGATLLWEQVQVDGHNPITGATVVATRRRLRRVECTADSQFTS